MLFFCLRLPSALLYICFDFLRRWHHAQCAELGGHDGSRRICSQQHFRQSCVIKCIQSVSEHVVQHVCTESISCSGGLNGVFIYESCHLCKMFSAICAAAFRPDRKADQTDVRIGFPQYLNSLIKIIFPGEPLDFVIGNLHDITMLHADGNLLFRLV